MSKTIDEKVVEMRFDNKHFESNVQTSLSTLDKLKSKLNLTGASKGLENISKVSKSVSFSNIEDSVASLEQRFSTMGIVGTTVIQNLTNSAMKLVKSLSDYSIGGIVSGGKSRATKIENARFQIKGLLKDYEDADKRLEDIMSNVNYGVESTAYGLDAAATVAAQLVASGMEAGDGMKAALRGISGVAAMTNSSYEDIGRIYTTVAGNGRLMGEQLLQLSSRGMNAAATLGKALNKTEAEVREMVSKGQIDFATFSKAMDDAFGEHAKDANKTMNGVLSNIKAALAKIGADFYSPIIAEDAPLVKFLNSVRERINEIRKTISPITNEITTKLNNFITTLNRLFTDNNLFGYNPLANIIDKVQSIKDILNGVTAPIKDAANTFNKVNTVLKDYETLVDEIIYGKWKNQPYRQKLLEEAGYNYYHAQNMVNERLGNSFRYVDTYTEATEQLTESTTELTKSIEEMSEEEMRNIGMTDDQIEALNELKKMAEKTGIPFKELLELLSSEDGKDTSAFNTRYLILNSLKNIGLTLVSVLKSVAKGFGEVFEFNPEGIFNLVAGFHKLTVIVKDRVEKNADKLTRTFKGLFSILHLITTLVGGGLKIGLSIINKVLGAFNVSILDITAIIGDAIYNFEKFITSNDTLIKIGKAGINLIVSIIKWIGKICNKIKDWIIQNEKIMSTIDKVRNTLKTFGDSIFTWTESLKEIDNVPKYIFEGLINGLKNGGQKVYEAIQNIGNKIVEIICKILGIHSPSTVFFAIGGFIIAGLIGGIQGKIPSLFAIFKNISTTMIGFLGKGGFVAVGALLIMGLISGMQSQQLSLLDVVKNIGNKVVEIFKQIDLGNIIAVGISIGILSIAKKMVSLIDKITSPLEGLTNLLSGLGSALENIGFAALDFTKAMKYNSIASIIKSISISIGILAASLWILAKLPSDQLKQGAIALGVISGVLAAFITLIALFSKRLASAKLPDVSKTLAVILGFSVGMLIMSKALKNIGTIDSDKMNIAIIGLLVCTLAMAALIAVLGAVTNELKGTKNIEKMSKVFIKISSSMLIIAIALKQMSKVEKSDILKMVIVMGSMLVLLASIAALNKWTGNSINKSAGTIIAVGGAILLLSIATKMCGKVSDNDIKNAIKVVGTFIGLLTALMLISKVFKGTEMVKISGSILMATVAIGMLVVVTKLASNMDAEAMKKGVICVGIMGTLVAALILVSKNSASFHGTTLVGIAAAIAVMAAAVWALGQLDPTKAENGIKAVGALSVFMAILITSAKNFNPGKSAMKTLITMTVMLTLLSAALVGLSFIDSTKLLSAASSLGIMITSLAVLIFSIGKMKISKGTFTTLATLTAIMLLMAGIISALASLPNTNNVIQAATGISILMAVLGVVALSLNKMDQRKKVNIKGIVQLGSLLIVVAGVATILSLMGNTQNAIQNALALSILLGAMTGTLALVSVIGQFLSAGVLAGVLGLVGIAASLILVVAALSMMDGLQNATTNAKALSILLLAMSASLVLVGLIGNLVVGVLAGVVGLAAIIGELFLVVKILQQMEGLQNAIPNALALSILLGAMSDALFKLSIVGPLALIADAAIFGLIGAITTIGVLATVIGALMDKFPQLQSFLDTGLPVLEQISSSIGKVLGGLIAGFVGSIADELPNIGLKLSLFMMNALPFITISKTVDKSSIEGVKNLALAILALTGANLVDSISTWLSNGKSFSNLGLELTKFAINALPFISMISAVKPEALQGAKNLADALLSFTASGLLDSLGSKLFGDTDFSDYGEKLGSLGQGLSSFVNNLSGFDDENLNMIQIACEGIKALAEASKEMPTGGGFLQALMGEIDMEQFSKDLPKLAEGLSGFVKTLTDGGFKSEHQSIIETACDCIKTFAETAKALPKEDGFWQALTGKQDLSTFADKFSDVAEGITSFVKTLVDGGFDDNKINLVNAATNVITAIASLGNINITETSNGLKNLGNNIATFATKISEFSSKLNETTTDDLNTAKTKIDIIIEIVNKMEEVNSDSLDKFNNSLSTFATESLRNFIDALKSEDIKSESISAITDLIDKLIETIENEKKPVNDKMTDLLNTAIDALKNSDGLSKVEIAGKNFVEGFAKGIRNNTYLATNAGSEMGNKALEAAKKSIDSHSPSKETFKLGNFFGVGFINGIKEYSDKAYNESYLMADNAKNGLGRAIAGVSKILSDGIDDDLTIRPIIDLSNIQSGAAAINSMFSNPSINAMSNVGAISYGMKSYRQNSGENVISAIDKLSNKLSNTKGDTFNINGISYDDGTEVAEAVKVLVRAAKIERRT